MILLFEIFEDYRKIYFSRFSLDSLKNSATHYTTFEEDFESSDIDGVKSRNASGFVQDGSKLYTHVGGENWTKTGDDKVDRVFTESK